MRVILSIATICCIVYSGCKSTPPPAPKPMPLTQVEQLLDTAINVSNSGNWLAAENTWAEVAKKYALLDMGDMQAIALHNQSYAAFKQGRYQIAHALATEAADINQEGAEWWKNQILLLQIEKIIQYSDYEQRLKSLIQKEEEVQLITKDIKSWGLLLNEQGVFLLEGGETEAAILIFNKIQNQLLLAPDERLDLTVKGNIALCHEREGNYILAHEEWNKILQEAKVRCDELQIARALQAKARCLWQEGAKEESLTYYRKAVNNYRWLSMKEEALKALDSLRKCYIEMDNSVEAEKISNEIIELNN